jgi:2-succinyl-5-enolpyruvyl-6-hydroxy-3-cyclohexene-1-carboxylate synthase
MLDFSNITSLWGSLIIEECIRNGIDYFCISPGSRSTPLTVAAARNPRAKTIICNDERGAAFHALGYGRATGKPAALICTSGTAVANYFPAVIEADVDQVPMLILGTDRPPELRDSMANQTIVQAGIFGRYVRYFCDLPAPTTEIALQAILTTVDQAVYRATETAGPVHINCMFRKPLEPGVAIDPRLMQTVAEQLPNYALSQEPYTRYTKNSGFSSVEMLLAAIEQTERGIIAVGQLKSDLEQRAVQKVIAALGWPAFTDITSGLRLGISEKTIIPHFDLALLRADLPEPPDTILHIGGQMVSKRFLDYIEKVRPARHILVKDTPSRHDPTHSVTLRFDVGIAEFIERVAEAVTVSQKRNDTAAAWEALNQKVEQALEQTPSTLGEIEVARLVSAEIPPHAALFIGNSMPIRDVDMFAVANGAQVPVGANRGASGIDGNLATACGFAVGLDRPTTLLLGDLTLLHDLNSLALLRHIAQPLTIIVINNSGGGIFHLLPIRQLEDVFETNFGTPHPFNFAHAAAMFGIDYETPETLGDLRASYCAAQTKQTHTLIEIKTDRNRNQASHLEAYAAIRGI